MAWLGIAAVAGVGLLLATSPEAFTKAIYDVQTYTADKKKAGSWGYVLLLIAGIWALTKLII